MDVETTRQHSLSCEQCASTSPFYLMEHFCLTYYLNSALLFFIVLPYYQSPYCCRWISPWGSIKCSLILHIQHLNTVWLSCPHKNPRRRSSEAKTRHTSLLWWRTQSSGLWSDRNLFLCFLYVQIRSRRQGQQRGGAHQPAMPGGSGDVNVASDSVTDTAGCGETDRWGQRVNIAKKTLHACTHVLYVNSSRSACFLAFRCVLGLCLHMWIILCGSLNINSTMLLLVVYLSPVFV